jgi:hypothetical protein
MNSLKFGALHLSGFHGIAIIPSEKSIDELPLKITVTHILPEVKPKQLKKERLME